MPRQIFGLFHAPLAYLRTFWCAAYLILVEKKVSVVFIDQVAAPILLFRLLTTINVLFYCHYPDLLLAGHSSWFRRLYRLPLNYIEKLSTGLASKILVNSKYTSAVFARTFKGLYISGTDPSILYPAVQSHQVRAYVPYASTDFTSVWAGSSPANYGIHGKCKTS